MDDRPSVLTEADYHRLAEILMQKSQHHCRFPTVDPDSLAESVKFYQNMNAFFTDSKRTIWKVFLTGSVGALMLIIGLGIIARIKEQLP